MLTSDLDYHLPPERIATAPVEPRDSARMLVVRRHPAAGEARVEHRVVRDLPELLRPGDAMVFNTTSVLSARLIAHRASGGRVEGLALEPAPGHASGCWRVLLRGSARLRPGERLELEAAGESHGDALELLGRDGEAWIARLTAPAGSEVPPEVILARSGHVPLPPYILRARQEHERAGEAPPEEEADRRWYETVYADPRQRRSVAAPTAGLHFTPELLARLGARGVGRIDILLHVGAGTFKPVESETLEAHRMHREHYEVGPEALAALGEVRRAGGRIIAVGTTSARTLESLADPLPDPREGLVAGETDLLIAPGHRWRHVDALMTNFHLPRSTLIALVAALVGLDELKRLYAEAVEREYRFYSYGDAMLVV